MGRGLGLGRGGVAGPDGGSKRVAVGCVGGAGGGSSGRRERGAKSLYDCF